MSGRGDIPRSLRKMKGWNPELNSQRNSAETKGEITLTLRGGKEKRTACKFADIVASETMC